MPTHAEDIRHLAEILKAGDVESAVRLCAEMIEKPADGRYPEIVLEIEEDVYAARDAATMLDLVYEAARDGKYDDLNEVVRAIAFVRKPLRDSIARIGQKTGLTK